MTTTWDRDDAPARSAARVSPTIGPDAESQSADRHQSARARGALALQRTIGNRATQTMIQRSARAVAVDRDSSNEVAPGPTPAPPAGARPSNLPSLGRRGAQPILTGTKKKDKVTTAGDAASVMHGAGSVASTGFRLAGMSGLSGAAITTMGVVGEVLGFVGIGLTVFGIAENAIRGRDAAIRFGAFTRAYQALDEGDPLRPYLQEAAKQQSWETKRRVIRVGVNSAILGLSIAALAVGAATTGGIILAAVAAVFAVGKAFETVRNIWRKHKAGAAQKEGARQLIADLSEAERHTLFDGLGITRIEQADIDQKTKNYANAVSALSPCLGRAELAHDRAAVEYVNSTLAAGDQLVEDHPSTSQAEESSTSDVEEFHGTEIETPESSSSAAASAGAATVEPDNPHPFGVSS